MRADIAARGYKSQETSNFNGTTIKMRGHSLSRARLKTKRQVLAQILICRKGEKKRRALASHQSINELAQRVQIIYQQEKQQLFWGLLVRARTT
jgi:hypothetical protein